MDPHGRVYYHNVQTDETSWDPPADAVGKPAAEGWVAVRGDDGEDYYYDASTGQTRWDKPSGFEEMLAERQRERSAARQQYAAEALRIQSATVAGRGAESSILEAALGGVQRSAQQHIEDTEAEALRSAVSQRMMLQNDDIDRLQPEPAPRQQQQQQQQQQQPQPAELTDGLPPIDPEQIFADGVAIWILVRFYQDVDPPNAAEDKIRRSIQTMVSVDPDRWQLKYFKMLKRKYKHDPRAYTEERVAARERAKARERMAAYGTSRASQSQPVRFWVAATNPAPLFTLPLLPVTFANHFVLYRAWICVILWRRCLLLHARSRGLVWTAEQQQKEQFLQW